MADRPRGSHRARNPPSSSAARLRGVAGAVDRVADVALAAKPVPLRILDVRCGAGELLREVAIRVPYGELYAGVDLDVEALGAAWRDGDPRFGYLQASADALPFAAASFDLVLAIGASAAAWPDQRAGVSELARVVAASGRVVIVDSASNIRALLAGAGLRLLRRERVHRRTLVLPPVHAWVASP